MLKLIACMDKFNSIGLNNNLIYKYKKDLEIFREKTINKTVVMGRKTFESIGGKPLSNRENIIVSKSLQNPHNNSFKVINDISTIIKLSRKKEIFIIGGKAIYEFFNPYYDEIHLTIIKPNYTCNYNINKSIKLYLNLSNFEIINSQDYNEFIINIYSKK